jgi:hypothetical protein
MMSCDADREMLFRSEGLAVRKAPGVGIEKSNIQYGDGFFGCPHIF